MTAAKSSHALSWVPNIDRDAGALYLLIAEALERDIRSGQLKNGAKLPAQRALGDALGVDFTTVTRAYTEARRRGLIEGRAGQGTFVRRLQQDEVTRDPQPDSLTVDMTMNLPPRFVNDAVSRAMWSDISSLSGVRPDGGDGLDTLLHYHVPGGTLDDRETGARWLAPRIPGIGADDVLLSSGAQGAIFALLTALVPSGGTVLSAELTYPGMITAADHLRIQLVGLKMDGDGICPEALEAACRKHPDAALYCNPTLHNPTTLTMSLGRRQEILRIAQAYGIAIIEDDAYGALVPEAPPPLRALAPEMVFYVAGLAKCLSPALRVAHLVLPTGRLRHTRDVGSALRATASVVSSLTASVTAKWIQTGTAEHVVQEIRKETRARHEIGCAILPEVFEAHPPESFHVWLELPHGMKRADFATRLGSVGVGVVQADAFALRDVPEAVRLTLGAARTRQDLERGLGHVADALAGPARAKAFVV
ncbi:PLP-dependent aminotransferase family protein [Falsirhodobacter deserti]|uniref:aminotransferase-like domain-containing protein n=1 Tax=Falsirhodobacter deserti TaxID=1365611 RepID=UPI000FE2CC12|nr:PLP-dependent aminotransferase family protein [Falsirhodobacter deserti]